MYNFIYVYNHFHYATILFVNNETILKMKLEKNKNFDEAISSMISNIHI